MSSMSTAALPADLTIDIQRDSTRVYGPVTYRRWLLWPVVGTIRLEWLLRVQDRAWVLLQNEWEGDFGLNGRGLLWNEWGADFGIEAAGLPCGSPRWLSDREAAGWFVRHKLEMPAALLARQEMAYPLLQMVKAQECKPVHMVKNRGAETDDLEPSVENLFRTREGRWLLSVAWFCIEGDCRIEDNAIVGDARHGWWDWHEELTLAQAEEWATQHFHILWDGPETAYPVVEDSTLPPGASDNKQRCPIELNHATRTVAVAGEDIGRLGKQSFAALAYLVQRFPEEVTVDEMEASTELAEVGSPGKALRNLRGQYPPLFEVLVPPGGRWERRGWSILPAE